MGQPGAAKSGAACDKPTRQGPDTGCKPPNQVKRGVQVRAGDSWTQHVREGVCLGVIKQRPQTDTRTGKPMVGHPPCCCTRDNTYSSASVIPVCQLEQLLLRQGQQVGVRVTRGEGGGRPLLLLFLLVLIPAPCTAAAAVSCQGCKDSRV